MALVLVGGCSLRGACRVLKVLFACLGWLDKVPHWTTGRLWLLRLGHARLHQPVQRRRDWAWLTDHSVQIGQDKLLVVLGLPLADLPPPGQCLRPADLRLLALEPMRSCTRPEAANALEQVAERTGVPRVIANDHGVDLHGGVCIFQASHPRTVEVYDTKHKAACLLKHALAQDERWSAFNSQVSQSRNAIQQTELAFLVPPGPRPKARYMNLGPLLRWGLKVLAVVTAPVQQVLQWVSRERLESKLGWLEGYREALGEWSEWQQLVDEAVVWVGQNGLSRQAGEQLGAVLERPLQWSSSAGLAAALQEFVMEQGRRARPGQRFPGSTEVVESCFGRFKTLERWQARGGLTSLVLAFGALLGEPSVAEVQAGLQSSRTPDVQQWCQDHLGTTLPAKRKIAFQPPAQQNPNERHGP